jgi:hypothetical protein
MIGEALDREGKPAVPLTVTGLKDLDGLLGGVLPGDLWLLSGAPRHGRTTFASLLATQAARLGLPTTVLVGVDGVADTTSRMVSAAGRIPLQKLREGGSAVSPRERAAVREASAWEVRLLSQADSSISRALHGAPPSSLVVVDDLDRWTEDPLDAVLEAKAWALNTGGAVILTLPLGVATSTSKTWQTWVRATDVIIELELLGGERLGEVDLTVIHNRRGPTMTSTVAAAYFYASLYDITLRDRLSDLPLSERIQDVGTPAWGSAEDWLLP